MLPLNFTAFSGLLTVLFSTVTAFVVLRGNLKNPVHATLGLFSVLVALWGLGIWLGFLAVSPQAALFWFRFLNETAMLIPIVFVHFVYAFLGLLTRRKYLLYAGYLLTLGYFTFTLYFYQYFIPGVSTHSAWFEFYPTAGPLYLPYFLGFIGFVLLGMAELFGVRKTASYQRRTQINYLLSALSVGFTGGSTTFPLVFGIPIYPFGAIGVTLLNAIFAYALVRHHLLDLSVALTKLISRLVTHLVVVTLASFAFYGLLGTNQWTLSQFASFAGLLVLGSEAYIWLRGYVNQLSEKLLLREKFDYEILTKECTQHLDRIVNLKQLRAGLPELLDKVQYRLTHLYLSSQFSTTAPKQDVFFDVSQPDMVLDSACDLVLNLDKSRHSLRYDEDRSESFFDMHQATVCVPLLAGAQLHGFMFIAKIDSKKKEPSVKEMSAFDFLSHQIGMTLFRLDAHSKELRVVEDLHQEKERALKSLAGSIAHEMRNPLAQVKYSLDSVEHALPSPTTEEISRPLTGDNLDELYRHLSYGQLAIKRGLQVISMTLDEVKGKALDPACFSYLSAEQTVRKAVEEYSYETEGERQKISIAVVQDFTFKGDETVAIFVLFNLIKNALYYFKTKPQASMVITVDAQVIRVRDTGPGILQETLTQLFESFKSVNKTSGTGLGLAYCKRSMQAFGGDIFCDSMVGQFTEFTLSFPTIPQTELMQYEQALLTKARAAFAGKRFLVVDDIETVRRITAHGLKNLGAEIFEAEDGQDAIEQLKHQRFDLIVMDLNMPVLDGYAAAEKIRASVVPHQKNIPIVACTTEAAFVARVKTQKVGINGFVGKPCGQFDLILTLQEVLEEAAKHPPPVAQADPLADLAGRSILIVDDEAFSRQILKRYLNRAGINVIEAEHGEAALACLSQVHIDLVLMDMQMPGLDGIATTERIRQVPSAYQNVKVVMLTANADEASMEVAYSAGANEFMTKPIALDPQYQHIRQLLTHMPYDQKIVPTTGVMPKVAPETSTAISVATYNAPDLPGTRIGVTTPLLNLRVLAVLKDSAFLRDVMPLFEIQSEKSIRLLKQYIAAQNLKQVDKTLHAYKGTSGSMGAQALHEMLRRLYEVTHLGSWPSESNWLERLQALHEQTLQALQNYSDDDVATPVDPQMIRVKSETMRSRAAEAIQNEAKNRARELLKPMPDMHKNNSSWQEAPLLNTTWLEQLKRLGTLEELPTDLQQVQSLLQKIREGVQTQNFDGAYHALHSLTGMSGSLGWTSLLKYLQQIHPSEKQRNWPNEEHWLETIEKLVTQSIQALHSQGYAN